MKNEAVAEREEALFVECLLAPGTVLGILYHFIQSLWFPSGHILMETNMKHWVPALDQGTVTHVVSFLHHKSFLWSETQTQTQGGQVPRANTWQSSSSHMAASKIHTVKPLSWLGSPPAPCCWDRPQLRSEAPVSGAQGRRVSISGASGNR